MKQKVLLFGAGFQDETYINQLKDKYEVIGFLDNDQSKWGKTICDIKILGNSKVVKNIIFDKVIINSSTGLNAIRAQLLAEGVDEEKIDSTRINTKYYARINFLHDFATVIRKTHPELFENDSVCVAEGGVYQGDFSKEINKAFYDKKMYLFDTFEGFAAEDVAIEQKNGYSNAQEHHLNNTSVELVLSKLPKPENAIIRKGYFPETTKGIEENFLFVNIDFDLNNPTYAACNFFYPKLTQGGVLLIHDYFVLPGVMSAVDKFLTEHKEIDITPIGDHTSIMISKH